MIIALACVALAGGLFAYVFFTRDEMETAPEKTRLAYLRERKEVIYENLRDLNFEYKACHGVVPPPSSARSCSMRCRILRLYQSRAPITRSMTRPRLSRR